MREFEEWWEDLLTLAFEKNSFHAIHMQKYPFMYEDYFEVGMTPQQAYEAEWVKLL